MRFNPLIILAVLFAAIVVFNTSCSKDKLLTSGGELTFDTDTLTFDTVFTTIGSFTCSLKIYNPQNSKVNISSVRLKTGDNSYFHLNVNGYEGNEVKDLELAAKDSMYVFATVNIDPRNSDNPQLVEDDLIATLNGNEYKVHFTAYGQDAHYLVDSTIEENATWLTDKPYVIIHSAAIDSGYTLTIPAGCRIFMNQDSRLYVFGSLNAVGTKTDSIIFQGNRLDRQYFGYEDYPAEWGGLYFHTTSVNNTLDWVVIKNAGNTTGLGFAAAIWTNAAMNIDHTIIENSFGYGLLCFNANITMKNSLIHSTGAQAIAVLQGGQYNISNCDFINYYPSKVSHKDQPTAYFLNYYEYEENKFYYGPLEANITNCVIYGTLDDEVICAKLDGTTTPASVNFRNCILKTKEPAALPTNLVTTTNCLLNVDPSFEDATKYNYRAKDNNSPMVNAGTNNISTPGNTDLDDRSRVNGTIDIGCYEF